MHVKKAQGGDLVGVLASAHETQVETPMDVLELLRKLRSRS